MSNEKQEKEKLVRINVMVTEQQAEWLNSQNNKSESVRDALGEAMKQPQEDDPLAIKERIEELQFQIRMIENNEEYRNLNANNEKLETVVKLKRSNETACPDEIIVSYKTENEQRVLTYMLITGNGRWWFDRNEVPSFTAESFEQFLKDNESELHVIESEQAQGKYKGIGEIKFYGDLERRLVERMISNLQLKSAAHRVYAKKLRDLQREAAFLKNKLMRK